MARSSDRRKPSPPRTKPVKTLDLLHAAEARELLGRLLAAHPELQAEAEQHANALLHAVSIEAVADEVEDAVAGLDEEEMYGHSGGKEWGYVDPGEAADEMLEEAIKPFRDDMKRHFELGMIPEAERICEGIVLGLYRVRDRKEDEVLGNAPDWPAEAAGWTVDLWANGGKEEGAARQDGKRRCGLQADFVKQCVPEWASFLTQDGRKR